MDRGIPLILLSFFHISSEKDGLYIESTGVLTSVWLGSEPFS